MKFIQLIISIILLIVLYICRSECYVTFCYYSTRSIYYNKISKNQISDLEPNLCTHIVYSYLGVGKDGAIISVDPNADLPPNADGLGKTRDLKKKDPTLKTILGIKIRKNETASFSKVIENYKNIQNFLTTALELMYTYKFDGLDIDWDYSNNRTLADRQNDRNNFMNFLKIISTTLKTYGYILSLAAVAEEPEVVKHIYYIPEMHKYLDFINLKTYNFCGIDSNKTCFSAPLTGTINKKLNVIAAVEYWINNGSPPHKLNIGVSTYSITFKLKNELENDIGSPVSGPGNPGIFYKQKGSYSYAEVCDREKSFTTRFNVHMKASYGHDKFIWLSYETRRSIYYKIEYIRQKNISGIMVWSIDGDDVFGYCGPKHSFLRLINDTFAGDVTLHKRDLHRDEIETLRIFPEALSQEIFVCPTSGLFPIVSYCNKFYFCNASNDTIPIIMSCPIGLYFDRKKRRCFKPASVVCDGVTKASKEFTKYIDNV